MIKMPIWFALIFFLPAAGASFAMLWWCTNLPYAVFAAGSGLAAISAGRFGNFFGSYPSPRPPVPPLLQLIIVPASLLGLGAVILGLVVFRWWGLVAHLFQGLCVVSSYVLLDSILRREPPKDAVAGLGLGLGIALVGAYLYWG